MKPETIVANDLYVLRLHASKVRSRSSAGNSPVKKLLDRLSVSGIEEIKSVSHFHVTRKLIAAEAKGLLSPNWLNFAISIGRVPFTAFSSNQKPRKLLNFSISVGMVPVIRLPNNARNSSVDKVNNSTGRELLAKKFLD